MPASFYDVVVLGTRLEPLLCGALLARQGLRVLVIGQGTPPPTYSVGDVEVEPSGLTLTGVQSPIVQSTLEALALRQEVRQRMNDRHGPLQLILPENRLNVYPDESAWLQEIVRELPGVKHQAQDITRTLGEIRAELDAFVDKSLTWPPETFIERQRFSFYASAQRYDRHGNGWTSWNQLANHHPLRRAFDAVLPHVSSLLPGQHSDATRSRLHAHLLEGMAEPVRGWHWFQNVLFGRIRSWGGDVRPKDHADALQPRARRGHTVVLGRTEEEIGCSQVVHGTSIGAILRLLPERDAMSGLFERVGEPRARAYRCSVHVLVDARVVPEALLSIGLICPSSASGRSAFWLRTERRPDETALLTACTLVDEHLVDTGSSPLRFVREEAMKALREVVPFLDEHAIWIDSSHDGLPPRSLRGTADPACSEPWLRGPYTMPAVYEYPTRRALGVCALPTRTPVRGLYLCSEQVAPGLGIEGSFLAATSVARIIGAQYRRNDWLRRGPWARRSV